MTTLYTPFFGLTLAPYTPTGPADSNFPVLNVADSVHGLREWRSTGVGLTEIVCDLSTATVLAGVFVNQVNFSPASIYGNATDSWGAPSFGPVSLTTVNDPQVSRRRGYLALTGFNYRYLKFSIGAQTPTDGAAYFRMGVLGLLPVLTDLGEPIEAPMEREILRGESLLEFPSGGDEGAVLGSQLIELTIQGRFNKDLPILAALWAVAAKGQTDPFVFHENDGDGSHVYLMRRRGAFSITDDQWPLVTVKGITMKEVG